jgi:hypothetical protein
MKTHKPAIFIGQMTSYQGKLILCTPSASPLLGFISARTRDTSTQSNESHPNTG